MNELVMALSNLASKAMPVQIEELLKLEESETLERKQSLDKEGICRSIIAFANDVNGRGMGRIILGQAADKTQ